MQFEDLLDGQPRVSLRVRRRILQELLPQFLPIEVVHSLCRLRLAAVSMSRGAAGYNPMLAAAIQPVRHLRTLAT